MIVEWIKLLENFHVNESSKNFFITYLIDNHKKIRFSPYTGQKYSAINAAIIVLRHVAKNDNIIKQKISELTPDIEDISEKIYSILTNIDRTCINGSVKKFDIFAMEYKFCKKHCLCYAENMKKNYHSKNAEQQENIKTKRKLTTKERFGVEHIMKSDEMKERVFKTNIQKYGKKSYLETKENRDHLKSICQTKYGTDSPLESDIIRQQIVETNKEKYKKDTFFGSKEWRKTYDLSCDKREDETGIRHYVQTDNFKEKAKKTSMDRYGTTHPNKSNEIIIKKQQNQILTNGRLSQHKNYSDTTLSILLDKENFENFLSSRSLSTAALELNINKTTISNYRRLYEIPFANSSYEMEMQHWLSENNIRFTPRYRGIKHNNGKSMEIDFFLVDYNVGIEINGLYWHSDKKVSNDYHYNKWKTCKDNNIRLFMITSNMLDDSVKKQIIFNRILNIIGMTPRGLPARKLKIDIPSISVCRDFVNKYHIQGYPRHVTASLGAYDNNGNIVAVMLFGKQRGSGALEMIRFCSDNQTHCGVFSKMLKHWRITNSETIITFADLSYSDGNLYRKTGFIEDKFIPPDYNYIKGNQLFHKSNFTKNKIKKKYGLDVINTEREAMITLGFSRYYDCGKIRFIYK